MATLKWNGKGSLAGIPARDLTEEEVNKFGKTLLLRSGLYEEVKSKEKEKDKEVR